MAPARRDNNNYSFIGYNGNGILNITSGGGVGNYRGSIGSNSGSTGIVTVNGANSGWTNYESLYIGDSGNGTLNIAGGGNVSNDDCEIGHNSGSTGVVTVDGAGSKWTNGSNLFIGDSGNGTLNITSGGNVTDANGLYIGFNSGSTGVVTVDGAGSKLTNNWVSTIGCNGNGKLNITSGGNVIDSVSSYIGDGSGSTGIVWLTAPTRNGL